MLPSRAHDIYKLGPCIEIIGSLGSRERLDQKSRISILNREVFLNALTNQIQTFIG